MELGCRISVCLLKLLNFASMFLISIGVIIRLSAREASANVAMHGTSGFGIYGVDVFVETDEAEKPMQILEDMDASISKEKF